MSNEGMQAGCVGVILMGVGVLLILGLRDARRENIETRAQSVRYCERLMTFAHTATDSHAVFTGQARPSVHMTCGELLP